MTMTDELQHLRAEGGSPTRIKYLQNKIKRATITEIRKLLKERGVRFNEFKLMTQWAGVFGENVEAYPIDRLPDKLYVKHLYLTPEQAIAATLGTGTCKLIETEHEQEMADEFGNGTFSYWAYDCSECGHENAEYGRFCAGCGRKVVDE